MLTNILHTIIYDYVAPIPPVNTHAIVHANERAADLWSENDIKERQLIVILQYIILSILFDVLFNSDIWSSRLHGFHGNVAVLLKDRAGKWNYVQMSMKKWSKRLKIGCFKIFIYRSIDWENLIAFVHILASIQSDALKLLMTTIWLSNWYK